MENGPPWGATRCADCNHDAMPLLASTPCRTTRLRLLPERKGDDADANHDQYVRDVEYASVHRSDADDRKVGHQTVTENTIKEIADPARHDQGKSDKAQHPHPNTTRQV